MSATPSTMVPLGTPMPEIMLPDPSGIIFRSDEIDRDLAVCVMFICNHCPFVKHIAAELAAISRDYGTAGERGHVQLIAINSNDVENYPQDAPPLMAEEAKQHGWEFPYLFDETQDVARAFDAVCTPDFFVYDMKRRLRYRGQLDASRPGNGESVTGADLRAALDSVVAEDPVPEPQWPSIGCNIKWKS